MSRDINTDPESEFTETEIDIEDHRHPTAGPWSADRLEYVLERLHKADELRSGLVWQSEFAEDVTVEELLGAMQEAEDILEYAKDVSRNE